MIYIVRDGFFIAGEHIAIDRNNSFFSETEGEPLFDAAHEPSPQLRRIQRVLSQLHAGIEATNVFISALLDSELIEPIDIAVGSDGGERISSRASIR